MPHGTGAERTRAAVVGSGVAGLTAAYLLQRAHDVTLYEADDRLGGHAHSHDIAHDDGRLVTLDSGFIVHNAHAYPGLLRLFGELGAGTRDSDMSMSVRCEGCGLEYAGARGPHGLFPAAGSLARPEYLAMLALFGLALRHPWVTAQVSALIRWQGIRLLARGHPVLRRPPHRPQEGVQ